MKEATFTITAEDHVEVFVYSWTPDDNTKIMGVVQIFHGMAEHAARYRDFAAYFAGAGFAVFANDHRGHGKTAGSVENTGYIAGNNSWKSILADTKLVNDHIHKILPNVPVIVYGHSMGSFYARAFLELYSGDLAGVVLSGTAWHPALVLGFGLTVAKIQCFTSGEKHKSKLLDKLSFGAFNKKFKPRATPFDWLSRDVDVCKKYTADDYCGWVASASFFRELFRLLKFIHRSALYQLTDTKIPVLIFSGEDDPVGDFSKGPRKMYEFLSKKGFTNVKLLLYPQGRHEMHNELNRLEVYKNMADWLAERL
ncbi:MAG TPA: alpha/beta fold hydrolase [Bacteroidales bacterium]|nr:lysophospholipase [Bacteroidales bacterium]HNZ43061.1 alpha/beta fold hydrolase [Bacteroidales bacterium]HPB25850.1 alpha/beta fold hydrolase [Bacteroidales bacterium]HPI30393.1 alpha/beta fold hydrolase [Bacteroidales bacterium]HQN16236.1 alpha/beta fold hydrolase [Bacteroidales bacterium]